MTVPGQSILLDKMLPSNKSDSMILTGSGFNLNFFIYPIVGNSMALIIIIK